MKRNFFTISGAVLILVMLILSIPAAIIGGFFAYIAMGGPRLILVGGKIFLGWTIVPMPFTPITPTVYVCQLIGAIVQWIFGREPNSENKKGKI